MIDHNNEPFIDDLDFLEAEIAWVTLRSARVGQAQQQRDDAASTRYRKAVWRRPNNTAEVEVPSDLDAMLAEEQAARAALDARIKATEASGVTLGIQKLVRDHDLDDADRSTVLLALVPCVGTRATDSIERLGGYAITGCVSAEVVARFCEFGFRDRLVRLRFDSTHKLVQAGLIKADLDDDASAGEWPSCSIKLANKGLVGITGLPLLV